MTRTTSARISPAKLTGTGLQTSDLKNICFFKNKTILETAGYQILLIEDRPKNHGLLETTKNFILKFLALLDFDF